MRDDMRTMIEVDAISEGTTDQRFLALRHAALEQSVTGGIGLPFLADDLFVNFDDQRAEAGFRVLAEVARATQVLLFTHHWHLVEIAKSVVAPNFIRNARFRDREAQGRVAAGRASTRLPPTAKHVLGGSSE